MFFFSPSLFAYICAARLLFVIRFLFFMNSCEMWQKIIFFFLPVQFPVLHLCFLFHLGPSPCRCGRLWAGPSGAPGCRRVTPTSSGSGWRSGCSVTLSTRSRWDGSWRTSCGCWGGSACRFTSWETSSACRGAADRSKAHSQVYRSRCSDHTMMSP